MANGILSDDQLLKVSGGVDAKDLEDISSNYSSCADWACASCRRSCPDKVHFCDNGGVSRTVCRYCLNYDSAAKECKIGRTVL